LSFAGQLARATKKDFLVDGLFSGRVGTLSAPNAVVTKQRSELFLSKSRNLSFSPDRFLRPAVEYSRFLAFWVNFWLFCSY
jgi:hypothetical protein